MYIILQVIGLKSAIGSEFSLHNPCFRNLELVTTHPERLLSSHPNHPLFSLTSPGLYFTCSHLAWTTLHPSSSRKDTASYSLISLGHIFISSHLLQTQLPVLSPRQDSTSHLPHLTQSQSRFTWTQPHFLSSRQDSISTALISLGRRFLFSHLTWT